MIENIDYVVCKVCEKHFRVLSGHIKDAHNIPSIKEYLIMYPNSITICSEAQAKRKRNREKTCYEKYGVYHVMKVPSLARKCYESASKTRLEKYGVKDSSQIPGVCEKIVNSRISRWMNEYGVPYHPEARVKAINNHYKKIKEKYNVINISQIPGIQFKKEKTWLNNYGVSNPMKSVDIMLKCFRSSNTSPNKAEEKIIKLNIENVHFVGDGKLLLGVLKKKKIPDFIVSPFSKTGKVIELFGEYYHGEKVTGENNQLHEDNIKQLYKNIGIDCLIIWSAELKNKENVINKIKNFISIKKDTFRDYTSNILFMDKDIVQYI